VPALVIPCKVYHTIIYIATFAALSAPGPVIDLEKGHLVLGPVLNPFLMVKKEALPQGHLQFIPRISS